MNKVGIDILEVDRINISDEFINRICTENEKEYLSKFSDKRQRLTGLFCAKEACFKSLDLPVMNYKEIEILHKENGRPYALLHGKTKHSVNIKNIDISISHTDTMATAICITDFNE